MVEAMTLVIIGTSLGTAWSTLGLYLGSLLISSNAPAAYTVRGIFLAIALLLHGFFRSHTPRIFLGTVLFIIPNVVSLVAPTKTLTATNVTQIIYPIFMAVGILLIVNVIVFPEFSSSYLGGTVTGGLQEIASVLRQSGEYFTQIKGPKRDNSEGGEQERQVYKMSSVSASKAAVRAKVNACKAAQRECNFELSYSTLPPRDLKVVTQLMAKISGNVAAIIGACESKFALVGDDSESESIISNETSTRGEGANSSDGTGAHTTTTSAIKLEDELELVKPRREIESGDPDLLLQLIQEITPPYMDIQGCADRAIDSVISNISYVYVSALFPTRDTVANQIQACATPTIGQENTCSGPAYGIG